MKKGIILVAGMVMVLSAIGCGTAHQNLNKELGISGQDFWDYYEAGLKFREVGGNDEAEACFRKAISIKDIDALRVRTEGYHYTDHGFSFVGYFPHGQLGITLFYQGRFTEATEELQASIVSIKKTRQADQTEFLSNAQEYLDRISGSGMVGCR